MILVVSAQLLRRSSQMSQSAGCQPIHDDMQLSIHDDMQLSVGGALAKSVASLLLPPATSAALPKNVTSLQLAMSAGSSLAKRGTQ